MKVVKTKDVRNVESFDATGLKTVRWFYGSIESFTAPNSVARYLMHDDSRQPGAFIDFSRTDFPECAWITPGAYSGIQTLGDHKCLVFTDSKSSYSPDQIAAAASAAQAAGKPFNASDYTSTSTAYVDLNTRLPIKNQVGSLTYTYQYLPPPTEMQPIPQLMKDRINFETQRAQGLSVHPAQD